MDGRIMPVSEDAERLFAQAGLTERERDVARSVVNGMPASAAARHMGIATSTVSSYRARCYRKLGIRNAQELKGLLPNGTDDAVLTGDETRSTLKDKGLSETETSVLACVIEGMTTPEIAQRLGYAPGTISAARAHGYRHLGVHSRDELRDMLARGTKATSAVAPEILNEQTPHPDTDTVPATTAPSRRHARAGMCAVAVIAFVAVSFVAGTNSFESQRNQERIERVASGIASEEGPYMTEYGPIPDVVGMDVYDASKALARYGFFPKIDYSASLEIRGSVTAMSVEDFRDGHSLATTYVQAVDGTIAAYDPLPRNWHAVAALKVSR